MNLPASRAPAPVRLTLPFPPTSNTYWRRVGPKVLISKKGRQYRVEVVREVASARVDGLGRRPCHVTIAAHMPDARRRDLDNLLKASLDALQAARVFDDDSQIVRLVVENAGLDRSRPRLEVEVLAA